MDITPVYEKLTGLQKVAPLETVDHSVWHLTSRPLPLPRPRPIPTGRAGVC